MDCSSRRVVTGIPVAYRLFGAPSGWRIVISLPYSKPCDGWPSVACACHVARIRATPEEAAQLVTKLNALRDLTLDPEHEDVHMNVEARLGALGARLHTARSRNDQVALDLRLYVRAAIDNITAALTDLRTALADQESVVLPGTTHLQHATAK